MWDVGELIRTVIFIVALILLARFALFLSRQFGLPTTSLHLTAGILLGPTFLNFLGFPITLGTWGSPSPTPLHGVLKTLAEIGLIQIMFLGGLRTDWAEVKRRLQPIFLTVATGSVLIAVGVTLITHWYVGRWGEALALGAIMTASSFGISAFTFGEMGLLRSRPVGIVLGSAAMNGVLSLLVMITGLAVNYAAAYGVFRMAIAVSWFVMTLVMFLAIAYFLLSCYIRRAETGFTKRPGQILTGYLLLVAILYAGSSIYFGGFAAVFVASLGGALMSTSKVGLREKVEKGLSSLPALLPVTTFLVVFGMEVNLKAPSGRFLFLGSLFAIVLTGRLIGSTLSAGQQIIPPFDRLVTAVGSLSQGEMGMMIAAYLFSRGLIIPPIFNLAIILMVLVTILAPILLRLVKRYGVQTT